MTQPDSDAKREDPRPDEVAAPNGTTVPHPGTEVVEPGEPVTDAEAAAAAADEKARAREESRVGRFLRSALRTLLLLAVVFGLGALTVYYFLYRPVVGQLEAVQSEAAQSAERLQQAEQNLEQAQSDLELANGRQQEAAGQLEVEVARVQVLRAMNELTNARMALADENKEGAIEALNASEEHLQPVLATLEERDSAQLETLQALYMLAKNDISRDPKLAVLDLDRLQTELDIAEKNVLK